MMNRLASVAALLLATGGLQAGERSYDFRVMLNSDEIGSHSFRITSHSNGVEEVQSEASFNARLLGIPVYRYRHRATEYWTDGCLQKIDAETIDNGKRQQVKGESRPGTFELESPGPQSMRSRCVSTYAYWDRERLLNSQFLLNPQTGALDPVRMEARGSAALTIGGVVVSAEHYRLHGENLSVDLWYSPDGDWLQLESRVAPKRLLRYRLR